MTTLVAPQKQLETLFAKLTAEWQQDTRYLSSTSAIATHPSYQRIIGLGPQVIPLILSDLKREPGHWILGLIRAYGGESGRSSGSRPDECDGGGLVAMGHR